MVQTERNQEKMVVTKICFFVSAKTEQKIKVCVMENKGYFTKMVKIRGNNYANFKTALFVKYLGSMLTEFPETSITGILLMR